MLELHWSELMGLVGISAIGGFFLTAVYFDRKADQLVETVRLTAEEEAKIQELSQAMEESLKRQAEPPKSEETLVLEKVRSNIKQLRPDLTDRPRAIEGKIIPPFGREGRC